MQSLAAILLYPHTVNRGGVPYSHAQVLSSGLEFLNLARSTLAFACHLNVSIY